ncbi:hypothetical protein V0242_24340 (plasmid) [Aeromonas hydrophila]|uniref:hypothetical protein n=1 Tax=Aeromonas hydrophila TaxID=644 RepID=UPI002ED643FD|nr:hypothetical protein V0242_24340 [Aeromonas hydrophila]
MIKTIAAGSSYFKGSKSVLKSAESSASLERQPKYYADPLTASYGMVSPGVTLYSPANPKTLSQDFQLFSMGGKPLNAQVAAVRALLSEAGYQFRVQSIAGSEHMTVDVPQLNGADVGVTSKSLIGLANKYLGYKFDPELNFTLYYEDGALLNQMSAMSGYLHISKTTENIRLLDLDNLEVKQILISQGQAGIIRACHELGCVGVYRTENVQTHDSGAVNVPTITLLKAHENKMSGVAVRETVPFTSNAIDIINFRERVFNMIGAGSPPPKLGLLESIKLLTPQESCASVSHQSPKMRI